MEHLNKFPLEFVKSFAFSFMLLNKINIKLIDNESFGFKKNWKFYLELPFVVLYNISMLLYLINLFRNGATPMEIAKSLSVYVIFVEAICKVLILLWKRTEIHKLVNDLGKRWRTSNLTQKQERNRTRSMNKLQWCLKALYCFNMIGASQHILGPMCYMIIERLFLSKPFKLVLPFGCVYPYDPFDNWFIYLVTYGYQAVIMYGVVNGYRGCECIMITSCASLVTEFAVLREKLVHITPVKENSLRDELIPNGRMAEQLDDIFNKIVTINMMFVIIIMCFFGFATSIAHGMIETTNNAVAVLVTLFPVYFFCLFGESLKEESLGIADSAYENLWYKGDVSYQKMILLIIVRSQRPCCLTLLKHVPVSLNMFTKVLSSTWSYFSLIRSVYSDI